MFGLICLSETYLNASITMDEKSLIIDGYKLIRADHPSNTRRGGVCIYHKETMSVKVLNFSQLSECLVFEISIQNKKGYFVTLYRSPGQSYDDFEIFLKEFEKLLTNIIKKSDFVIIHGDFNAKSTTWWSGDTNNVEDNNIEALTSYHAFVQVINEPTHILPNSSSC